MRFRKEGKKKGGLGIALDMTPILDMVFNLLIFFAVSLNFAATSGGINIKLPKAKSAEPVRAEQITINLTTDGNTYLNNKRISISDLRNKLESDDKKESLVIIRADDSVNHGRVVEIMDIVKTADFTKLAIAVDQAPSPPKDKK